MMISDRTLLLILTLLGLTLTALFLFYLWERFFVTHEHDATLLTIVNAALLFVCTVLVALEVISVAKHMP